MAPRKKGKQDTQDSEVLASLKGLADRMAQLEVQISQRSVPPSVVSKSSRRRHQSPPHDTSDIDENIRARVNSRLKSLHNTFASTSSDEHDSDESAPNMLKQGKKSGRSRIANFHVKINIIWPHEFIYDDQGNPAKFDDLSIPQFVNGFLLMIGEAKPTIAPHMTAILQEAMEDAQRHPWQSVRACVAIFLQQIEMGRAKWSDDGTRIQLRRTHIWNALQKSSQQKSTVSLRRDDGPRRSFDAKPDTKVCFKYNSDACQTAHEHPDRLHICAFCLKKENKMFRHPQKLCRRQARNLNESSGGQ